MLPVQSKLPQLSKQEKPAKRDNLFPKNGKLASTLASGVAGCASRPALLRSTVGGGLGTCRCVRSPCQLCFRAHFILLAVPSLRSQNSAQIPQLLFHFVRTCNGVGDLLADKLLVAAAHSLHRLFEGFFRHFNFSRGFRIGFLFG